jgi:hypothetical protein
VEAHGEVVEAHGELKPTARHLFQHCLDFHLGPDRVRGQMVQFNPGADRGRAHRQRATVATVARSAKASTGSSPLPRTTVVSDSVTAQGKATLRPAVRVMTTLAVPPRSTQGSRGP